MYPTVQIITIRKKGWIRSRSRNRLRKDLNKKKDSMQDKYCFLCQKNDRTGNRIRYPMQKKIIKS